MGLIKVSASQMPNMVFFRPSAMPVSMGLSFLPIHSPNRKWKRHKAAVVAAIATTDKRALLSLSRTKAEAPADAMKTLARKRRKAAPECCTTQLAAAGLAHLRAKLRPSGMNRSTMTGPATSRAAMEASRAATHGNVQGMVKAAKMLVSKTEVVTKATSRCKKRVIAGAAAAVGAAAIANEANAISRLKGEMEKKSKRGRLRLTASTLKCPHCSSRRERRMSRKARKSIAMRLYLMTKENCPAPGTSTPNPMNANMAILRLKTIPAP